MRIPGTRRWHTLLERLLEEILFDTPDCAGRQVVIDQTVVESRLKNIIDHEDLSRYIL